MDRLLCIKALAVRRVYIPKPGTTKQRPLGIPTCRDRVVQQALLQRLAPIFEPDWDDASFGYRRHHSTKDALAKIWRELQAQILVQCSLPYCCLATRSFSLTFTHFRKGIGFRLAFPRPRGFVHRSRLVAQGRRAYYLLGASIRFRPACSNPRIALHI